MFATRVLAALAVFCATAAAAQQSTSVTASAAQMTIDYGVPVTLTGTVNGGSSPTGSIRFTDAAGGAPVTVALTNRSASFTATNLAPGGHPFTLDYLGDASNLPSSATLSVYVRPFPPGVTSIVPSHLPAGSLDSLLFLHGTDFGPASTVTVNGTQVSSTYDSPTQMRAFLTPNLLANPGSLAIAVTNSQASSTVPAPAPYSFTVDPPGPAPLALGFSGPLATATGLTPGGKSVWLFVTSLPDQYTTYYSAWTQTVTDSDSDGQVSIDSRQQNPPYSVFPRTNAAVVDVATGNVRIDVTPDRARSEAFFPITGVTGVRNGEITSIALAPYYYLYFEVIVVRPGVGAWQSYPNQHMEPRRFQPLAGSPPAPATFLPDDVLVAIGGNVATRARLGDYLPQGDPAHPGLIVDDAEVLEGDSGFSQLQFGVHLSSAASAPVTVSYTTDGSYASADDFTAASGTLTFQPGETLKTVSVAVAGDHLYEDDDRVVLTLSGAGSTPILHGTATGWILNDDPLPTISIGDAAPVVEGSAANSRGTLVFPVTLSAPSGTYVDLDMTLLADGTADNGDLDFTVDYRMLIPPGTTNTSWNVLLSPDLYDEDDEVLSVRIYSVAGAARGRDRATGVILDDDAPPVLTPQPVSVREGTGTDTTIDIPITAAGSSLKPVSVDYQLVANGTASSADFVLASGTLSLQYPVYEGYGRTNVVTATIKADALREGPETFSLVLSHPANATLGSTPSATITIADDDSGNGVYAAAVLRDQPFLYYRLNEPSGSAVIDASPNGNNAVVGTGAKHNVPGALGSGDPAVQMPANSYPDARILLPMSGLGGATWSEATIEAWVNILAVPSGSSSSVTAGEDYGFFWINASATSCSASIRADGMYLPLIGGPLTPGWHHVVLVAKSNVSRLYVDGAVAATSSTSFVALGAAVSPAISGTNAGVDEFAIYHKAFTAADVARHYALRGDGRATADFDGNASNDLVLRNQSTGANALWLMNRTAYASTVNLPYLPSDFRIEGSADFDGDGQYDLLLRNYTNGNNALWLMNGTALKAIVNLPWLPTASDFRFEGTGDMNGDGWPDILIRNYTNGNDAVWLMNGTSFAGIANLPALPDPNYRMAGSGDFDGDGKADIVWRNRVTGNDAVWLMNGLALASIANLPALPNTDYRFNGIADYDGDGKPDLVLRNYSNGANALWLLDGVALKSVVNLPMLPNTAYEIVGPR